MSQSNNDRTRKELAEWKHWEDIAQFFNSSLGMVPCTILTKQRQAEHLKALGFVTRTEKDNGAVIGTHPGITRKMLEILWKTGVPLEKITVTL